MTNGIHGYGSDPRLERHEIIIEKLVEQQIRTEELLKATIQRTAEYGQDIKDIKKEGVDIGKILEKMNLKFNIVQWVVVAIIAALISYVVPHMLPK